MCALLVLVMQHTQLQCLTSPTSLSIVDACRQMYKPQTASCVADVVQHVTTKGTVSNCTTKGTVNTDSLHARCNRSSYSRCGCIKLVQSRS